LVIRTELNKILVRHTGQPLEKIERDTDRNYFLSAEEARDYRIVDKVITKPDPALKPVPVPVG
jgi:ATP-dependent Clp protease protease subunit